MKNVSFNYGLSKILLSLPDRAIPFALSEPERIVSKVRFLAQLDKLLSHEVITDTIAIVVADKTRLCGYDLILPWIVTYLQQRGAQKDSIRFYIAYGTHPRQTKEECRAAYGIVYDTYQFIHHDCCDAPFVTLGRTDSGTAVKIRQDLVDSSLILTIGAVSHHYFAGYGGGRKLIFPGLAEKQEIYANHRLFLDQENQQLSHACWPGNLVKNPVASDLKQIHDLLPHYLSIHALMDSKGRVARYYFGSTYEEFLSVCRELDCCFTLDLNKQYDLVVVSTGGYPKDINFIQTHKSIHHAANLVRDGGKLLVLAECRDGVGSNTFLPYFQYGGKDGAFRELCTQYVGNGGTALAMMEKTDRIRIYLKTELPESVCKAINTERISSDQIQAMISKHNGTLAYISNGSMMITRRWSQAAEQVCNPRHNLG